MTPVNDVSRKAEFAYDYLPLTRVRRSLGVASRHVPHGGTRRVKGGCRRVQKKVYNRTSGAWVLASDERFVYDQWNVVMVLDGQDSNATLRKYTWGLDLSGLAGQSPERKRAGGIHGAGGIGGLLAVEETSTTNSPSYWLFYDGNGNVGQVISASDQSLAARYEYDPYGNAIVADGTYAATNPFRFSTKWLDTETGLGYWGERYYWFRLGRWGNRDPIEEEGGLNLCAFVRNACPNTIDAAGTAVFVPILGGIALYTSGCALCALHVKHDIDENYLGKGYNDKFIHCVAACKLARKCPPGTATVGSILQEIPPSIDAGEDLAADGQGMRYSFKFWRTCDELCEHSYSRYPPKPKPKG